VLPHGTRSLRSRVSGCGAINFAHAALGEPTWLSRAQADQLAMLRQRKRITQEEYIARLNALRGQFGLQPVQGGDRNVSTNRSWAARSALPGWPLIPHQHSAGGGVGGQYSRVISTRHCIPLLNRPAIPQALELDLLKILPMSPSRTENSDHLVGLKRLCNNIESSKVKGFRP
jgi:hypothetical protein